MGRPRKPVDQLHICDERANLTIAEADDLKKYSEITGYSRASLLRAAWKKYKIELDQEYGGDDSIAA